MQLTQCKKIGKKEKRKKEPPTEIERVNIFV